MTDIVFAHPDFDGHEQVVFAASPAAGLRAIIAIHDTRLGPALGGCRVWPYPDDAAALTDALRLSSGMSRKAALAGLALGGGKSVIIADSRSEKTPAMMRAFGRAVDQLGGRYITAEDVGSTMDDMDAIAEETPHVAGTSTTEGDPSPYTGEGVFLALEAAAARRFGSGLEGIHVVVKGLGHVGEQLCRRLHASGARLTVADIRPEAVAGAQRDLGCDAVPVPEAHKVAADVYAPCALGAELNAETIPEIAAAVICGAANNQLATAEDDARLLAAGKLYCPDYLVNAGGLISVARRPLGLHDDAVAAKVAAIPKTLAAILDRAEAEGRPTGAVADALALARIRGTA